jgi:hypothetical protein
MIIIQLDEYQFEEENLTLDDELTEQTDRNKDNSPPGKHTTVTIQQLISRIAVGQIAESIKIIKFMPSATIPTLMADAISLSVSVKLHVRKNIHKICRHLGALFIVEEKDKFLDRLAQIGSPVDFASVILDIRYANFKPVLALSGDIMTTVALIELQPGRESELVDILCDLYLKSWDHKVAVLKASRRYAKKLKLNYTKLLQVQIPMGFRRQTARHRVADICISVNNGRLSGTEAFKKCLLHAGNDSEARETSLDAAGLLPPLHHALAKIWSIKADSAIESNQTLFNSTPCEGKYDYCHLPPVIHSKVVSDAQAMSAIKVLKGAKLAYVAIRSINDPTTFVDNPGMISFMIMAKAHVYQSFPCSKRALDKERLSQLVSALAQCRLYVWSGTHCKKGLEKLGATVRDCLEALSHPSCRNMKGNVPERIYFAATGRRYCLATYKNVFRDPEDVDPVALTHVGSELYATSILYPKPS